MDEHILKAVSALKQIRDELDRLANELEHEAKYDTTDRPTVYKVPMQKGHKIVEAEWIADWYETYPSMEFVHWAIKTAIGFYRDNPSRRPAKLARKAMGACLSAYWPNWVAKHPRVGKANLSKKYGRKH